MLLISDLHLEPQRPDITATLLHLLRNRARDADRLYILGDLFEVWIGDDEPNPLADAVATALADLAASGTAVFLMHGNRDFLMGTEFAARCRASLVQEPLVLEYQGRRYGLLHGDVLCTRDTAYLEFRRQVRDPQWQQVFLARPLEERRAFARQARQQSQDSMRDKPLAIMDVSPDAVAPLMQELQVSTLIHGHTHRPAIHPLRLTPAIGGHGDGRRVVLGDWDKQGWLVAIEGQDLRLEAFPLVG
ncbi:MAG: hypothetical protein RLZZ385_1971 [Pseudomonadota bacterium]